MIIAPSILSADFLKLASEIQEAEAAGADWIHIDVMDGHFVPNLTMGPFIVEACRRATGLPLDVHLMIESPEQSLDSYADAGADRLTIHVEASSDLQKTVERIRSHGVLPGVALSPATPAESIHELIGAVDLILVMTVNPGYSGQTFIENTLPKVIKFKQLKDRGETEALIQVDGGISAETAPIAARAGAEVFVAASAVFKHPEGTAAGIRAMREALRTTTIET
jgi:ribulose-phosphate 3-epimerase